MDLMQEVSGLDAKQVGVLEVKAFKRGVEVGSFKEENTIVKGSSTILRDLMIGNSVKITKVHIGDMGLDEDDDLKNVSPASVNDKSLKRKLFQADLSMTKETYQGDPAIKYTATLAENEFNGDGRQLITEYALANNAGDIFSRKTRSAVYKDSETSLLITWWLVFK